MTRMIELTDLMTDDRKPVVVPVHEVAPQLRKWNPGSWVAAAIDEFQEALLAEDFAAMAELAGELGIAYDFPK